MCLVRSLKPIVLFMFPVRREMFEKCNKVHFELEYMGLASDGEIR
jgi:hypothetical protein